ncbi:MAG TPA: hypothetical protein VEV42_08305 [Pyrinomonadaceae bacterium]|jgi:hypothetical protein|nr:hypothetical protein [Pyrinomonadaceae bacterium]
MRSKFLLTCCCLLLFITAQATTPAEKDLTGRWQVKFTFAGRTEMNLVFDAQAKGGGTFLFLDTAPDSKPEASPRPAAWLQTTNDRVGFSGETELPFGTCCRETGTLIFKGKFGSNGSLTGKVIFVGSTEEEENPIGFRAMIGTFTATRLSSR